MSTAKPIVIITGASGNLGRSIVAALQEEFQIVGMDRRAVEGLGVPMVAADLCSDRAVAHALTAVLARRGSHIAAVLDLIAYDDSSGEDTPPYQTVNGERTRRLVRGLGDFAVE